MRYIRLRHLVTNRTDNLKPYVWDIQAYGQIGRWAAL